MKLSSLLLIGTACAVGAFVALRIDHAIENRKAKAEVRWSPAPLSAAGFEDGKTADFREAARRILPSVVSVDNYREVETMTLETYLQEAATGSGVILSSDGTIVTNNHVIRGASVVKVRLNDKRTLSAKVIGADPRSDLAVLKIDAKDLTPIAIGDSSKIEIGQWVVAVGNPLNYEGTVSVGVVSSLGRNLIAGGSEEGQAVLLDAIQTDAAINSGNSGGALTDASGALIGINSAIASTSGGSIGIGFAIPVNRVKKVVEDILRYGHARYGELGIQFRADSAAALGDPDYRQAYSREIGPNVPQSGLIIRTVFEGSPAAKAGIQPYDILIELDGTKVEDNISIAKILYQKKPGDSVRVRFWSKGNVKDSRIVLEELTGA